ncbi:MAG: DUF4389 domain-containing protein [Deltaproteobacteria bacterium]|nr:DUF4389 domain-containing protein [Deltaproteobacteria bacterium]MBI4796148.1 DUF4389 domain-containing protein [Deltaproteobacteria bacterium]
MNEQTQTPVTRGQIAMRLLYTLLFVAVFCILKVIVYLTTLFQFVYLFITLQHSEPVRAFANKVVTYAYRVWRYITLNENRRPFPFTDFPEAMESPEEEVSFQ